MAFKRSLLGLPESGPQRPLSHNYCQNGNNRASSAHYRGCLRVLNLENAVVPSVDVTVLREC